MSQVKKCKALTQTRKKCSRNAIDGEIYCGQHLKIYKPVEKKEQIIEENSELFEKYNEIISNNRRGTQSEKYILEFDAENLILHIIEYLDLNLPKTKKELVNFINVNYQLNLNIPESSTYPYSLKKEALEIIESQGVDTISLINSTIRYIFEHVSTYTSPDKRIITYLNINEVIAHNTELRKILETLIVPSKYTLLRSYYTKHIPVHIVETEFKSHNLSITKEAIHFVQQYIYWNFNNLSIEDKVILFPKSNPSSITDFYKSWFQKMLSQFKKTHGKIEYKQITDLILKDDILSESEVQKIKIAEEFLELDISKDVTQNIFRGYL